MSPTAIASGSVLARPVARSPIAGLIQMPAIPLPWDRVLSHTPAARAYALAGYSAETRTAITRLIALSPVLEDAILGVAELAFADGAESADG